MNRLELAQIEFDYDELMKQNLEEFGGMEREEGREGGRE